MSESGTKSGQGSSDNLRIIGASTQSLPSTTRSGGRGELSGVKCLSVRLPGSLPRVSVGYSFVVHQVHSSLWSPTVERTGVRVPGGRVRGTRS